MNSLPVRLILSLILSLYIYLEQYVHKCLETKEFSEEPMKLKYKECPIYF